MPYNWGPHYLVPSEVMKIYSGAVQLREEYRDDLLQKELDEMNLSGPILKVVNPWYFRKKGTDTWIKVGESDDRHRNFPVTWDTSGLENGQYEVLGLMHVFIKINGESKAVARENVVEVEVEH